MTVQTRGIAWPLVVSQACDINTDTSCHRTTNPDMAPGSSMGSDVPIASTCYMVAAQTIDILLAFGGNSRHRHRHRHKHRHQLQQDHGPRCGPQQQPPPGPHPGLFICLILTIFKSSFHLSPQCTDSSALFSLPSFRCVSHLSYVSIIHSSILEAPMAGAWVSFFQPPQADMTRCVRGHLSLVCPGSR